MTCPKDALPTAIDSGPNGFLLAFYKLGLAFLVCFGVVSNAKAGKADVIDAEITCNDSGTCMVRATVVHSDSGWEHYANHWRILTPDGKEIGRRVLHHPHENEQPFTRALSNLKIPMGIDQISVQAHDNVHGYGGKKYTLNVQN